MNAKRTAKFNIQKFYIKSTEHISGLRRFVNLNCLYNVPEQHLASNQDGLRFLFGTTWTRKWILLRHSNNNLYTQ